MNARNQLLAIVALVALAAATAHPRVSSATFVVSPRSEVRDLSSAELRRIFLGQTARWRDHHRIVICLPPARSPEETLLLERVVRMSAIDFSQQWVGAVFRGEAASAPHLFDSRESLLKAVSENRYAIGVVATSDQTVSPAVAITIDGKSPDDPSYPVQR